MKDPLSGLKSGVHEAPPMIATPNTTPMSTAPVPPAPVNEMRSGLLDSFEDFDDETNYQKYMKEAVHKDTANFVVRFGVDNAEIATNLGLQDIGALLETVSSGKKDDKLPVTWIHLWSTFGDNRSIVERITTHYKFSTRLTYSILTWDGARRQLAENSKANGPSESDKQEHRVRRRPASASSRVADPEKGVVDAFNGEVGKSAETGRPGSAPELPTLQEEDLDMFRLVQSTYNYTTIDYGPDFICIGANWLHERPTLQKQEKQEDLDRVYEESGKLVPPKHWAWYILTSDWTVISIQEAPTYLDTPKGAKVSEKEIRELQSSELQSMRKNTRALLSQLSRIGIKEYRGRLSSQKGVRSDLKKKFDDGSMTNTRTNGLESSDEVDASTNLFYYLFEEYSAGISILKHSNNILTRLTYEVLHVADRKNRNKDSSRIIKTLYARGKDLRQLKHLFQSYEKLIKGIQNLGTDSGNDERDNMTSSATNLLGTPLRGVKLSQKAYDRFERLNDRLKLLVLNTIEEYLEEKRSLSDTYFNLLALKDSQATSKLNRSASLLAKLSVFFLPISFMTSYFSVQIPDLTNNYTGTTYWVTFAVIATLSFLSLFFFSRLLMNVSDLLDEKVHNAQKWSWRTITSPLRKKRPDGEEDEGGGGGDKMYDE